jgi:hypothetical protein
MTQVLMNGTNPLNAVTLDANFSELYNRTQLLSSTATGLGVNVTPSTWFNSRIPLSMSANGAFASSLAAVSDGTMEIWANSYLNASVQSIYQSTGCAALFQVNNGGSGGYAWSTAVSGTGGAVAAMTIRMTLDVSGNLSLGQSAAGLLNTNGFSFTQGSYQTNNHSSGTSSGSGYIVFGYNAALIGSITQSGTTGVAYNTASDYRLKDNPQPIAGSGTFIDALKPCTWTWKSDGSAGTGFIAHELQAVSPASVTGAKDAVDVDGKPIFQAVEYGSAEVIAMLVAEVQDLRRRLHTAGL